MHSWRHRSRLRPLLLFACRYLSDVNVDASFALAGRAAHSLSSIASREGYNPPPPPPNWVTGLVYGRLSIRLQVPCNVSNDCNCNMQRVPAVCVCVCEEIAYTHTHLCKQQRVCVHHHQVLHLSIVSHAKQMPKTD